MRKIFTLLLLLAGLSGVAQYNNEWIKHQQTYYNLKIARAGIYRIPKTVLDAAGIGNAQVQNLELWRNGQRVPFYPSVSAGVLPGNGYIEFWGEPNDGKADKALYRDPTYQHTDYRSLQTDTAVYFLSVNTNQSGFRFADVTNNIAGNSLPAEPFFMYTEGRYPINLRNRNAMPNPGFAAVIGTYVYSSSYDKGEFFACQDFKPSESYSESLPDLYVYNGGPNSTLKFGATGNALNTRTVKVRVNGTEVKDTVMDYFNDLVTTAPVATSSIASGPATVLFNNTSAEAADRMVVSFFELTYPREFNFGGKTNFKFTLPAKDNGNGYYLRITNFTYGSTAPVLYDLVHRERYVGDISTSGIVQFALPGTTTDRQLVLVSAEASNITTVTGLTTRNFIDYKNTANQGTYLIISNPILYNGTSGNNPVADYKNYRESAAGGGHKKVIIADINELVDQFAFGIKKHPLSIRNFIRFARDSFAQKPEYVFLIGRGMTYSEYQKGDRYPGDFPLNEQLNLVPTFGNPASDNLLSSETLNIPVAATPIGRLSVVNAKEIEDYLEKVKEYELTQKNSPNTLDGRAWMKNIIHVTGSSDPYLGTVLCNYMNVYRQIIEDTLFGGRVTMFCKESTNPVEQVSSERLTQLFEEGISFLTYFGHSSSTTLEFNIDNPQAYNNQGKYPIFFVNGCNAGNFFTYFAQRMVSNETLSEKFVLAKQRGTIAFVASTHFGIVNYLNLFLTNLYNVIGRTDFNKTLGETNRDAMQLMINATSSVDFYSRMHAEQITLHGDPAISINTQQKPDYIVEAKSLQVNPLFISIAENSYKLKIKVTNTGKAVKDSVVLEVKQQYPDGSNSILYRNKIPGIRYIDSLTLDIPIVASRDKGQNKITVTIDADFNVNEIAENNNIATRDIFIFEDEARPAYPYNYAIINNPTQKLFASTANPLSALRNFVMEIDTTEHFNSASKVTKSLSSVGGVLEFNSELTYKDSTVYYWRVAPVPASGNDFLWSNFSFTYMPNTEGFNMAHYYQHLKLQTERVFLDTASKTWKYGSRDNNIFVRNCIYQFPTCLHDQDFSVSVSSFNKKIESACVGNSVIFHVFDSVTLKPWINVDANGNNLYRYGSGQANCNTNRYYNFEFSYMTPASRKLAMDFMDSIPNGSYVVVRSVFYNDPQGLAPTWMKDTALYGSNKSLYHKLLAAGFVEIDSIYQPRPWAMVYKKGAGGLFIPKYGFGSFSDRITMSVDVKTPDTLGYITSPVFGPAKKWKEVKWDGMSLEDPSEDNPIIDIIGIDNNRIESTLFRLDRNTKSFDVSSVDPVQYPYLKLKMRNIDSVRLTPYQLKYWRILYDPVPEGAIAPNLYLVSKDTLELGEVFKFGVAFKNISNLSFDSMLVKVSITDKDNVTHNIPLSKLKPIISGDTVKIYFEVDTRNYAGNNILNVHFNPENHQAEYYSFNNFIFKNFYVRPDNIDPLLDVTFDGVHILNRDLVSAKPHIQIKLKDEAKYMLLDDTTVSSVEIRYPDGNLRTYHFDGDTLRFMPASSGNDNTATIDFTPVFTQQIKPEGDEYELIVKGKDKSGNKAGNIAYRVYFRIITKPMISNLLNYPNPFSTSTAFVFTITGSDLPQNIRIQILTVTGKIVREITMNELGPLHIGRNITEFKWDGTDQYGQKLGNGVYLYRVITSMNGKPMEKYKAEGDDTNKYFNNGYGKMYLMR